MTDRNEQYPFVPGYLTREPHDLFTRELEHYERISRVITSATRFLFDSCLVLPEDLEKLQQLDGRPVVLAGSHEGVGDIPVMSMVAIKGGLGPIRMVSKVDGNMDTAFKSFFNRHLGAFPIDRENKVVAGSLRY